MAPDIALAKIEKLSWPGDTVLDPMCGSGTVPQLASTEKRRAIACDIDPLAVLITRTACKPKWSDNLAERAVQAVAQAKRLSDSPPGWIAHDPNSMTFIEYWFDDDQRRSLSQLARVLIKRPSTDDALRVALSRLIVTKDGGASLARDTSHSRPHRVRDSNSFDVFEEFVKSAERLESLADSVDPEHQASIRSVDARSLGFIRAGSVRLVMTSPPYLNAIDYLRGHRMSLVWLGWSITELRILRSESIGTERGLPKSVAGESPIADTAVPDMESLSSRHQRMVLRFTLDLNRLCKSLSRVTAPKGHLVLVVADSMLGGISVPNSEICRLTAEAHSFKLTESVVRPLPSQHRYLPPPESGLSTLETRMREEAVLTFVRSSA
jgi:DNA modification methylase